MDKPRIFYNIDGQSYDAYLSNIQKYKNILVHTCNLFNAKVDFPIHHLYLVLKKEYLYSKIDTKINLHFIVNDRKIASYVYSDLRKIIENTDQNNNCVVSYTDKSRRLRERKFLKMNLLLNKFNIYFYLINTEAPRFRRDDYNSEFHMMSEVYLLFLYTQLSQLSTEVIIASCDNELYSNYILPKTFLTWLPFTLVLFQIETPSLIQRLILNEVINFKDHLFILEFFKNDRYEKIPKIGYSHILSMGRITAFSQRFI